MATTPALHDTCTTPPNTAVLQDSYYHGTTYMTTTTIVLQDSYPPCTAGSSSSQNSKIHTVYRSHDASSSSTPTAALPLQVQQALMQQSSPTYQYFVDLAPLAQQHLARLHHHTT